MTLPQPMSGTEGISGRAGRAGARPGQERDAGLDHDVAGLVVDLEHAVHPVQVDHDAARYAGLAPPYP